MIGDSYGTLSQFIDVLLAQGHRDIRIVEAFPVYDSTWLTFTSQLHGQSWSDMVIQESGKIYPIIPF